jgi:mRNA interferase HigB
MRVISAKRLREFYDRHQTAKNPLRDWLKLMEADHARDLAELKRTFGSVDYLSVKKQGLHIFNIGGNKYRLIAAVHYKSQMVFVRHVLTHQEYDRQEWRQNP